MKILNFISGFCSRNSNRASRLMLLLFMLLAHSLQADQSFEALDKEFLEFLSLYDVEDEEILKIALDEEAVTTNQTSKQTEGDN